MISFALCLLVGEYGDDKIGDLSVCRLFQSLSLIVVVCSFFLFYIECLFLVSWRGRMRSVLCLFYIDCL